MTPRPEHPAPPPPRIARQTLVDVDLGVWQHGREQYSARLAIRLPLIGALVRAALASPRLRSTAAGGAFTVLCQRVAPAQGAPAAPPTGAP
jgi:hypothetical protein